MDQNIQTTLETVIVESTFRSDLNVQDQDTRMNNLGQIWSDIWDFVSWAFLNLISSNYKWEMKNCEIRQVLFLKNPYL